VAEQFSNIPGQYVSLADTIAGFREILDGKHDDKSESDFYMKGSIDQVGAKKSDKADDKKPAAKKGKK
jgi:F-type H+-transporting ATPase subunit beta